MPVGLWPYNIGITPNGRIGISADNGNSGAPDGHVDTVSVIDLEATPVRVIDRVVVGDAPEGFVISPRGDVAVAVLLGGASLPRGPNSWYWLPEGAVFSPDGKYLYVGNYIDRDVSILKVDGTTITNTGKKLSLPGQPASMLSRHP